MFLIVLDWFVACSMSVPIFLIGHSNNTQKLLSNLFSKLIARLNIIDYHCKCQDFGNVCFPKISRQCRCVMLPTDPPPLTRENDHQTMS